MKEDIREYQKVLLAIQQGMVVSDQKDEDNFVILVDEDRNIDEECKPLKSLILEMEQLGFLDIIEKETKREYLNFDGKKRPLSLITIYEVSDKGLEILNT